MALFFVVVVMALAVLGIGAVAQRSNSEKQAVQVPNDAAHDYGDYDPANEDAAPLQLKTFQPPVSNIKQCSPSDTVAVDLVVDTSNSMRKNNRLGEMKSSVKSFAELLKQDDLIGVEQFDAEARTVFEINHYSENKAGFTGAIDGLSTRFATHIKDGLALAHADIQKARTKYNGNYKWIVILLTDGSPVPAATQNPQDEAVTLKSDNIRLITIGLEINKEKADMLLGSIASSPQDYYTAASPESLQSIYSQISTSLCR